MKCIFPVDVIAITQGYHSGYSIDFGTMKGEIAKAPILAWADGTVYRTETQKTGGKVIFIQHSNGWVSEYGHCDRIDVKKGQTVTCGQQIGIKGKTGQASGIHLHFKVYKKASYIYAKTKDKTVPVLDYMFMQENQRTSETTAKKYPNLHKAGEIKTCSGNKVRIRKTPKIAVGNTTGRFLNKGDQVKVYEYYKEFYKISNTEEL